ncbi:ABC transporter permease [Xylanimonas allomyrinae]|uniref:ABC transporter permease n=1 Tax=Xylanimonas allomyrinae TaxID=2509459 RepID=A0A4P6EMB2_9MICO|nr:ABC transporter permease [Xylanimonas allomyrinae]QAY62873.1 ABC transporter permease [Xylanimonas allomyrinae]
MIARTPGRMFGPVLRWQLLRMRRWIVTLVAFQLVVGIGVAFGLGNLLVADDVAGRQYLVSGVATTVLLATGLVLVPSLVFRARENGALEYLLLQQFPRPYLLLADLLIWTFVATPGAVASVVLAAWHFDVELSPSPLVIVAGVATIMVAVCSGYLLGLLAPSLAITNVVANACLLFTLLYTPISFPSGNLEPWLVSAQKWLPSWYAADLLRRYYGLDSLADFEPMVSWLILGGWALALGTLATLLLTFPSRRITSVA